jgi:murein DD-endopeptidase MepM/ murein hydrolase activator NlpD
VLVALSWAGAESGSKSKQQLERELALHKQKLAKIRSGLRTSRAGARKAKLDMAEVDRRLNTIQREMDRTAERLERSVAELDDAIVAQSRAALEVALRRDQLCARLRTIYKQGESRFISVLAGTESVGDLASRSYILRRIAKKDREIADSFLRAQQQLAERRAAQARLVARIRAAMLAQTREENALQQALEDKAEAYREAMKQVAYHETLYAAENAATEQIQAELARYHATTGTANPVTPWTGVYRKPVEGPITSGYGMRMHPILGERRMHTGIDIGAPYGTPIKAAAAGRVIRADYYSGYGNCVILDHGGGMTTLYAHCSAILVSVGQDVEQGHVIARVGATGLATGPHLHFEIRQGGKPIKPN